MVVSTFVDVDRHAHLFAAFEEEMFEDDPPEYLRRDFEIAGWYLTLVLP